MVKLSLKRKNIPKGVDIIMSSRSLLKNSDKLVLKQSTSLCGKLPRVSFPEETLMDFVVLGLLHVCGYLCTCILQMRTG